MPPAPMSNFDLSVLFFLQLAFILGICRIVGALFARMGQSQVVSEMIAGVIMGPSLMGAFFPSAQAYMFPKASNTILFAVAQIGLAVYMFTIGLEFDVNLIKSRMKSALSISAAGIIAPFFLGGVIALYLYGRPEFFAPSASSTEVILFMGASMSITAFPMLARIIYERGLAGTSLGTLALAAGSLDDAAAWCVLAIVLASFTDTPAFAATAIGGGVAYVLVVMLLGRPLLARLGKIVEREGRMSNGMLAVVLSLVMLGAWFTDYIHIYAVFGAFIMGIAMPRGLFAREVERLVGPMTTTFLLPLFFVYSGLNTKIGLVNTPALWLLVGAVIFAATLGKGFACWAAARLNGESNSDALAIGTLMNARGLMELIILNIGLERGIITPTLFTIMVLMAIVTTLMATPIFERVYRRVPHAAGAVPGTVPDALL
ncbi:MAG: cation:proton antiporter [Gemmatimonadota bacterium]|nr:cation:proton antiporter [Gemmatimonadota bacterium]